MWLPPYYLLFNVTIDGEKYLGRVKVLGYEQGFNKPSEGVFNSYKSIEDFKKEIIDEEIRTSSEKVVILEIIDTHSEQHPSSINNLINLCKALNNMPNNTDIGTLRRNIPDLLEEIGYSISDFSILHPNVRRNDTLENIKELIKEIKRIPDNYSVEDRKSFITDLKERISYLVDNLIRFSETTL
jgi:superfamily I DNA/RNA helicase